MWNECTSFSCMRIRIQLERVISMFSIRLDESAGPRYCPSSSKILNRTIRVRHSRRWYRFISHRLGRWKIVVRMFKLRLASDIVKFLQYSRHFHAPSSHLTAESQKGVLGEPDEKVPRHFLFDRVAALRPSAPISIKVAVEAPTIRHSDSRPPLVTEPMPRMRPDGKSVPASLRCMRDLIQRRNKSVQFEQARQKTCKS